MQRQSYNNIPIYTSEEIEKNGWVDGINAPDELILLNFNEGNVTNPDSFQPKYHLERTDKEVASTGVKLYQIVYDMDIDGLVEKGNKGGFMSLDSYLSHYDNCVLLDDSVLAEYAKILDNAIVTDESIVHKNSVIDKYAIVQDCIVSNSRVSGKSHRSLVAANSYVTGSGNLYNSIIQDCNVTSEMVNSCVAGWNINTRIFNGINYIKREDGRYDTELLGIKFAPKNQILASNFLNAANDKPESKAIAIAMTGYMERHCSPEEGITQEKYEETLETVLKELASFINVYDSEPVDVDNMMQDFWAYGDKYYDYLKKEGFLEGDFREIMLDGVDENTVFPDVFVPYKANEAYKLKNRRPKYILKKSDKEDLYEVIYLDKRGRINKKVKGGFVEKGSYISHMDQARVVNGAIVRGESEIWGDSVVDGKDTELQDCLLVNAEVTDSKIVRSQLEDARVSDANINESKLVKGAGVIYGDLDYVLVDGQQVVSTGLKNVIVNNGHVMIGVADEGVLTPLNKDNKVDPIVGALDRKVFVNKIGQDNTKLSPMNLFVYCNAMSHELNKCVELSKSHVRQAQNSVLAKLGIEGGYRNNDYIKKATELLSDREFWDRGDELQAVMQEDKSSVSTLEILRRKKREH